MQLNKFINRDETKINIINTINQITSNINDISQKKVIYIMGNPGSGKSYFMNQLLKELDYDIIPFDTEQNRNSSNFDFTKSSSAELRISSV